MYKVCKFGGSSLANAEQFKRVRDIVLSDDDRHIVVVSAVGKSNKADNKVTDLLYLIFQHHKYHVDATPLFNQVKKKYLDIQKELNISIDLEEEFDELKERLDNDELTEEELVSRGEYFSAKLMAAYLGFDFVDAKELINFDYEGKVVEEETNECIEKAVAVHDYFVVPGFYGSYPNYKICLFSRGGSDVTGSYMAKGAEADLYENFTDVSGFYMADPRIVENPRHISQISFDELRELAYMGASVLHEETILPLAEHDIPLVILNTNHPEESGTWIKKTPSARKHLITGITGKKGFTAFTFVKDKSVDKLEVLLKVLAVFKEFHVPVEHVPTSIDSFCVVVEKKTMEEKYYDLVSELKKIPNIISIDEDEDIALLAVVGGNMVKKTGSSGRVLSVFGEEHINIKLIDQGLEEFNIIIGISNANFDRSIRALYNRFAHEKIDDMK
ncbi:MAG: aspartate kinase [Bacilli bacterium]|jgi:aspartate kinase|nr:aspartate kinase [Bacilli bacterium]